MTLEELARGATEKAIELHAQLAALKEENERLKARAALLAAPAVQGELVATLLIGEPEHTKQGCELGDWDIGPNATAIEAFAKLAGPGTYPLYTVPQPAEQKSELAKYQPCGCVICTCEHETQCQGCGGHHCGTHPVGQFTAPAYLRPAPDVAALVEALEQCITSMLDSGYRANAVVIRAARAALSTHRKGAKP